MQLTPVREALNSAKKDFGRCTQSAVGGNTGYGPTAYRTSNAQYAALAMLTEHIERLTDEFVKQHPESAARLSPDNIQTKFERYWGY